MRTRSEKMKNTWKIKKAFDVKYAHHIGVEMEVVVRNPKQLPKIIEMLQDMQYKMYCIRTKDEILADERGIKCSKL